LDKGGCAPHSAKPEQIPPRRRQRLLAQAGCAPVLIRVNSADARYKFVKKNYLDF